jgi:hypothetical protein
MEVKVQPIKKYPVIEFKRNKHVASWFLTVDLEFLTKTKAFTSVYGIKLRA